MLYVLRQRLKAQKIEIEKTVQVLDDVTAALLNPKILSCIFAETSFGGMSYLRSTLECVALSSIMKLDRSSMDKLFDLMIMMTKYQLTAATGPREVILLTLNHTDAMRDMVSNPSAQQCVGLVHQMVIDFYGCLTFDEVWKAKSDCLKKLEPYCVRVSILLRLGLQNEDTTFNLVPQKYNEKYEENRSKLCDFKIADPNSKTLGSGSFNLFGDRETLLGKNIYSPTYGTSAKLDPRRNNERFLKDCGIKAELGMLAVQLGTEEAASGRPFTLNLLSNNDNEKVDANKDCNSIENKQSNEEKIEKTRYNEEYKTKLGNVYADFFEDQQEKRKDSTDLLQLLDEYE
ncbi:hypothetical protein KM043_011407 [Ampulex compressa]|nr:hypothetical protein KM043_011407 [Ampulex compressa]